MNSLLPLKPSRYLSPRYLFARVFGNLPSLLEPDGRKTPLAIYLGGPDIDSRRLILQTLTPLLSLFNSI